MNRIVLQTEYIPTDEELKQAIEIRFSSCFSAMNVANAFSGTETVAWRLARLNAADLIFEARKRNLPAETWVGADHKPINESNLWRIVEEKLGKA